jgi:hypothetical protein
MPMLDAYIPEAALSPSAERKLLAKLTDLLIEHEGVDASNQMARKMAWVFVHRPQVYVAGARQGRRATASSVRSRRPV